MLKTTYLRQSLKLRILRTIKKLRKKRAEFSIMSHSQKLFPSSLIEIKLLYEYFSIDYAEHHRFRANNCLPSVRSYKNPANNCSLVVSEVTFLRAFWSRFLPYHLRSANRTMRVNFQESNRRKTFEFSGL